MKTSYQQVKSIYLKLNHLITLKIKIQVEEKKILKKSSNIIYSDFYHFFIIAQQCTLLQSLLQKLYLLAKSKK